MGRLDGKVALITGAARGLGRAHALRLAQEGACIAALDICKDVASAHTNLAQPSDMDETVRQVEESGGRIFASSTDVRVFEEVQAAVDECVRRFGSIDIVCANAAITSFAPAWEITAEAWRDVLDVNLTGTWHTAKAAIPSMISAGRGGSIVFVNSVNGLKSGPGIAHYAAAKHGAVGLMRSLASELGPHGIRVNTVHPTMVATPMAINDTSLARYFPDHPNPTVDMMAERMRGRHALPVPWVEAVDISNAVLWLSSDEARYVTGATVPVDAGMLIK